MLVSLIGLAGPAEALKARSAVLKASPVYAYAGKPVTFSGTLTKSPRGSIIRIQRKSGTSWVGVGSTTTSSSRGAFSKVLTLPSTPGKYTFRAFAPRTRKLAGVYSKAIVVTALRRTTATLTASPTAINPGQTSTLSGSVTPYVAGTKVSVQRRSGDSWIQVGAPALTASGTYSLAVTPTATTRYRVATPLTGLNAGTVSAEKTVTVTDSSAPTITTTALPNGDQYLAYTTTLTKTGLAGTWSVPAGSLPGGLSLNADTGVLSGTPTGSGSRNLVVTFTETSTGLSATKTLPLTIGAAPAITTATLPEATRGTAYTANLAKTGGAGTWSIEGLPAGLSIDASTGQITGTTWAVAGDYGVYPTFTETSTGRSVLKAFALHVGGAPLTITTDTTLPDGHRDGAYSVTFTKNGGPGTWAAVQIPDGFALDPATGTLTGTPTVAGLYAVYVSYTEDGGGSVTKGFSLTVLQPKITTTTIPAAVTGTPYSVQLTKTGLDGIWEASGFLPDGFALSTSGLLTGDPTETGDFYFQVTFTETSTGAFSKQAYILHVEDPGSPTITTTSLPNGSVGTPYSATLAADPAGGTWSVTTGSLPVGLSLNPTTGAITGTPSVPENAQFVVTYTLNSTQNTKVFSLVVPQPAP